MTSRKLVIKTLNHEPVSRVAHDLWVPSGEDDSVGSDALAEMNVRYPSDIVQPEVADTRQEVDRQTEQGQRLYRRLGLCLALGRTRDAAGAESLAPGRRRQDRRLSAASRAAGEIAVCQGQQELRGDQSLRAGLVGGPAIRPAAVSSRRRGGVDGPRPRHRRIFAAFWRCFTISPARRSSFGPRRRSTAWRSATIGARPKDCC